MAGRPCITIWIHGTNIQPILGEPLSSFHANIIHDFMYCQPGLHLAKKLDSKYYHHTIAKQLYKSSPELFPWKSLYLFGWTGSLNPLDRIEAAKKLYHDILHLVHISIQKYRKMPFIRIITHSHGGNVALNLAKVIDRKNIPVHIDELLLLACPVQKLTSVYVKNPLFKQIYSVHTHTDIAQIVDPQGWPQVKKALKNVFKKGFWEGLKDVVNQFEKEPFFSQRHFSPHSKILQIRVTIDNKEPLHAQFMFPEFIRVIPLLLEKVAEKNFESDISVPDIRIALSVKKF